MNRKSRTLSPLAGIIPPLVTPLRDTDTLDAAGLERLLEHVVAGGVHGVFILGTSGEAPHLSYRLRRELIERTCRQVAGRVPVLVGITDTSLAEAQALARHAANAGASMVVSSAPFYFPIGQEQLREYIERLLDGLPLPLVLYNMPQMTKVSFEPATVAALAQHERVVGIKDSSGDLECFTRFVEATRARADFSCLVGPEQLLVESMRRGGRGGVNGGANVAPRLFVELHDAVKRGDAARAGALQKRASLLREIYAVGTPPVAVIQGMKCALSLLGICGDTMTSPFRPLTIAQRERVRALLKAADVWMS